MSLSLSAGRQRLGGLLDIEALADFLAAGAGPAPDPVPRITLVE